VKWSYAPNLGLSGVYRWANVGGFTGQNTSWAITLGLQWVLWDGGLREANLRESNAKVAEAKASATLAENKARDEVRRGLLDLASARANRTKAEEQLRLARESQRLVDVNFKAGVSTYLEVTDANTSLAAAETGFVGETLNASLAALRVLKAAGMFNPQPQPQQAQ
jgi:outer membrane protein TolC